MADFNPDQYLNEKTSQAPTFDPDAYLKAKSGATPESSLKTIARNTINLSAPVLGGIGGAALATPETAGVGTVAGGAIGYAAGKHVARILDHYILGDPWEQKDLKATAVRAGEDLRDGALFEAGGQALNAIPGMVKGGVNSVKSALAKSVGEGIEYTPAANKAQILKAAEGLNLNPPRAVLTDNPVYQKLESGLSQSGSVPAKGVREQYKNFFKGVDDASGKIENLKSADSDFALGSAFKDDLSKQIADGAKPVSEMYSKLAPELKKVPVNEVVVNKAFGALKRNPLFQTQQGRQLAEEMQQAVKDVGDLNSLKEFRSTLHDSLGPNSAPLDAKRMDAIYDAVTSVRDNTLNSLKDGRSAEGGKWDSLIDGIANADAAHQAHLEQLNSVKRLVGKNDVGSPASFLKKVDNAGEGDLVQRAANLDVASMQNLKQSFPSVFEKAQAAKVNDMIRGSTNPVSGFNVSRFMKQYDGLDKEMKDLLFSKDVQEHIENLKTVKQAIPEKLGPSGTPEGQMLMDMFNPKRNALDFGINKVLNNSAKPKIPEIAKPGAADFAGRAANVGKPARLLEMIPRSDSASAASAPAAAAADNQPTKGPAKWANDGVQKLIDHAPDDKDTIEKAKGAMNNDPKVKSLLVAASDLKPGSKAMEKLLAQLKSKLKESN